jgi:peptide/nickel transport system substrate-binding protein/oligopeptide transport system substrate-binding protein
MRPSPGRPRRFPAIGIVLAVGLGVGAAVAFLFAIRVLRGNDTPVPGGTLRVAVVGLGSLDPADARDPTAVMVAHHLFDTLVGYDPKTLEPRPALAQTWEANPEQTVLTFHLQPRAHFHDGSPITSGDVKFSLERIARKGSNSPLVTQLDTVAGFAAYHIDGTAPGLAGVEAPDPATVVIRLDRPFSTFPTVLGHPGFGVVPKAAVERLGDDFKSAPVGSGPFQLVPVPGDRLRLVRFGGHKPLAKLDAIELHRFADAEAAYRGVGNGQVDISPVPAASAADAAKRYGTRGMQPYLGLAFYAMNLKSPHLSDARLRKAIALAIDRERIVRDVYKDTVKLATGLVSDGLPGKATDACGEVCQHDVARAKALVTEAFPNGGVPEVAIDHDDDATQAAVAASIKADLDAAGIPTALRSHPFDQYGQFIVSGQQELFRLGWIADFPSPDAFLAPLFSSTSADNVTGLSVPEVDDALKAARAEADPAKQQSFYREAERRVLSQYVVVPVAQLESRLAVVKRVQSFTLSPLGTFDGAAVTLAAS